MKRSARLVAILLGALAFASPAAVLAAFNGSISSTSAHPGDRVTVVSTDSGPFVVGATGLYLMRTVDPSRAERAIDCADEPGSLFLGPFERVGSTVRLVFVVPAVTPGDYEVRMDVPSASPSCWRLWPFEVLAAMPPTDLRPTPAVARSSGSVALTIGTLAALGLLAGLLRAGQRGDIGDRY